MIITQEDLIIQIAHNEGLNPDIVKEVFKSAEDIISERFSSVIPSEAVTVKLLRGISLERKYIPSKCYSKGMFRNINCPERVRTKASLSKYYNEQINRKLFSQTDRNGGSV